MTTPLIIVVGAVILVLGLLEWLRWFGYRLAIDVIEILSRYSQGRTDCDRQRTQLEIWEQYAIGRLSDNRKRIKGSVSDE